MTFREYKRLSKPYDAGWLGIGTVYGQDYYLSSTNSPRNSLGKLVLKPNQLTYKNDVLKSFDVRVGLQGGLAVSVAPPGANVERPDALPPNWRNWAPEENQASARFYGKLRSGSASLGVTIASWKQSQDMVVKRLGDAQRALDRTFRRLSRDKHEVQRLRREREPLANQILETEFGWLPLISDVRAALLTVMQKGVPDRSVKGVGLSYWDESQHLPNKDVQWLGSARVTYSATVAIENPNLWLANRAGLVNLPGIAWDLVPWSFVVNMFGNFNQIISSFTNDVGLTITDQCLTKSVKMVTQKREVSIPAADFEVQPVTVSSMLYKSRSRALGVAPNVSLVAKVPDVNWETCLIAGSLVVQRIRRINNLIRIV